jgi:phosphoserine phosphatase
LLLACFLVVMTVWLSQAMGRADFFIESTRAELAIHRAEGAEIVLVSGSFYEILAPICAHLETDALLCTELEMVGDVCTGSITRQIIGDGKWDAIRLYLDARADTNLEDCYGYGDHVSDVIFMEKVGHPVVVGDSAAMLEIARQRNWRVISSEMTSGPLGTTDPTARYKERG